MGRERQSMSIISNGGGYGETRALHTTASRTSVSLLDKEIEGIEA
jgi:hypothetical protein